MENYAWGLSFCDASRPVGDQHLGTCWLLAPSLEDAVTKSHVSGLNPGGEIQIVGPIDPTVVPDFQPFDVLQSRAEIEAMDGN